MTGPFRWWHKEEWRNPVVTEVLYRRDPWVKVFLAHLDDRLKGSHLRSAKLEADRDALVVTGEVEPGSETLRLARAKYRDILLFHPKLQRDVEVKVNAAVVAAAAECSRRNYVVGEDIRRGGRAFLLENPSTLLHPDVVDGLRGLELSGLPPVGISGVIEVQSSDGTYVVASMRSTRVAVNPGCLGPSVDGGLPYSPAGIDPRAGLRSEISLELPWDFDDGQFELLGTVLPPVQPTLVAGRHRTRRCGVNVVYWARLEREPFEVFRSAPAHFEARELMLIRSSEPAAPGQLPAILRCRNDRELVPVTDVPPMSEVLVSSLAWHDLVQASIDETEATTRPARSRSPLRTTKASPMNTTPLPANELTLEDAWAEDLIERHGRLNRVLGHERLANLGETDEPPTLESIAPVFDAVREFEFVRVSKRIKASDEARLFEAIVYRIGRYLFANSEDRALAAHDLMLPRDKFRTLEEGEDPNPIGSAYRSQLDDVLKQDVEEDPTGVWREDVERALRELNQEEAVLEYAEVARTGRLLCFCAALWCLEAKTSPDASLVALKDVYRKSLSGEVIALFFRARALLVSPVLSAAQAQLGLQFVTTALSSYPYNPGMHHTRAIFLLRQSALTEIEAVSNRCLQEALGSVETALLWDAEFAKFYATRARVKYKLRDRAGALIDIRAAIELARFGEASPLVAREVKEWESLLETWQLAPFGDLDG